MRLLFGLLIIITARAQMVWFEPNRGQVAGQTQWVGRSKGAHLYITGDEVVFASQNNVHMRLVGASKQAKVEGDAPTGGYSSYFTGRDEKTWFTGIPHYAKVRYRDVYPGIDMVYYGSGKNVEYDFVVKPGGDPQRIELAFSEPVKLDRGDLVVAGMRQHRPRVLQDGREIAASYRIGAHGNVQLALGEWDRSREFTVDPVLEFSTYLGGPGEDHATGVVIDPSGNVVVAGGTQSPASPSLNPFQQTNLVGSQPFVIKLTADGQRVLYFAVVTSGGYDEAKSLAIDTLGNVLITGITISGTFPLKNAFLADFKSTYYSAFVIKLAPDGKSLVFSSYLGGSVVDDPHAIAVDKDGNVFIGGETGSKDFPVKNAIQPMYAGSTRDWFITKVSPTGQLLASTYLGGAGGGFEGCSAIAFSADGGVLLAGYSGAADFPLKRPFQNAPVPGNNSAVLVKMTPDLQSIVASTFVGGPAWGIAKSIAVDSRGNIWIGSGGGANFPTTPDAVQRATESGGGSILAQIDAGMTGIQYATYLGDGAYTSYVYGIAFDRNGFTYASGSAGGPEFPSKNALQKWLGGGINHNDCFMVKLSPLRSLIYATPLGGSGSEFCGPVALDAAGNAYTVGGTYSFDFPVKNAYQSTYGGGGDGFLLKISDSTIPPTSPLIVAPQRLTFRYTQEGPIRVSQAVTVTGGDFSALASAAWVATTTHGSILNVSVQPGSLAPGVYATTISLRPSVGADASLDVSLTILAPAAVITSVDPPLIPLGSDDTGLTIHGSRFTKDSIVQIDGLPWTITPVQLLDSGTLKLTLPKGYFTVQFNHLISVQNPGSDLSNVLSVAVGKPGPFFAAGGVTNAASFVPGPVAPGEIVTIFGTNLAPVATFDDIPATLTFFSPEQVSVTVPYAIQGPATTLKIGSSAPVRLSVAPAAPGVFAVVAGDGGLLTIYATGCGVLTKDDLPQCALPVSVTVNELPAEVLYAGIAPGLPEGANQINVRLPDGLSGTLRIVLKAGDASSKEFLFTLP